MSVTTVAKRYKTINLDGSLCFAILRSLATREAKLQRQLDAGEAAGEAPELLQYLQNQLFDLRVARTVFNSTPFVEA